MKNQPKIEQQQYTAPCEALLITGMTFQEIDAQLWVTVKRLKQKIKIERKRARRAMRQKRFHSGWVHVAKANSYKYALDQLSDWFCPF